MPPKPNPPPPGKSPYKLPKTAEKNNVTYGDNAFGPLIGMGSKNQKHFTKGGKKRTTKKKKKKTTKKIKSRKLFFFFG